MREICKPKHPSGLSYWGVLAIGPGDHDFTPDYDGFHATLRRFSLKDCPCLARDTKEQIDKSL
jgi:hypothetical protein